jgi:hypothetical protein
VKLTVTDNGGQKSSDTTFAVISDKPNTPPDKPLIYGDQTGKKNTNYNYTATSTDQDNDNIKYTFNWDDETAIMVTDYVQSGTSYTIMHSWANPGIYTIKVSAIDEHNYTSETSELMVLIDTVFCDNIGYIMDTDGDGVFDLFHNNATGNNNEIKTENNNFLIDSNEDGKWDYSFNPSSGLSVYQEETKKDEIPIFELIVVIIVVICVIIALILLWRRKRIMV